MPARKPIGAETRAETRTSGSVRRIGCQPAPQRMRTTIPKPIAPKRTNIQAPRRSPGPRSRPRSGWAPDGRRGRLRSSSRAGHPFLLVTCFLGRLNEERHERIELLLREQLPEVLRHDVLRVAGLNVRIRVDDRLANERVERLV